MAGANVGDGCKAALDKALADISRALPHGFSDEIVNEVQLLIDFDPKCFGALQAWLSIVDVFRKNGIGHDEENVCADDCIVHTDNRGGLGLNAYDAHRNGDTALLAGADPQELAKALSIELCPIEPLKSFLAQRYRYRV